MKITLLTAATASVLGMMAVCGLGLGVAMAKDDFEKTKLGDLGCSNGQLAKVVDGIWDCVDDESAARPEIAMAYITFENATCGDQDTLTIVGTRLAPDGEAPVPAEVLLGDDPAPLLTCEGEADSSIGLTRVLPDVPAGDYRLSVCANPEDCEEIGTYDLTIGAVGPKGDPGEAGPQGEKGIVTPSSCPTGQYVTGVRADGTFICAASLAPSIVIANFPAKKQLSSGRYVILARVACPAATTLTSLGAGPKAPAGNCNTGGGGTYFAFDFGIIDSKNGYCNFTSALSFEIDALRSICTCVAVCSPA